MRFFSSSRASMISLVNTPDKGFFFLGGFLPEKWYEVKFGYRKVWIIKGKCSKPWTML